MRIIQWAVVIFLIIFIIGRIGHEDTFRGQFILITVLASIIISLVVDKVHK